MTMRAWRVLADWAKSRPRVLRWVDRAGRGRGRARFLDHLHFRRERELRPDFSRWHELDFACMWLGHASVLIRLGGTTILTDPVFSRKVGPGMIFATLGPRRSEVGIVNPALLPPVDVVLLSHAHFDHLDRPTLARLDKRATVISASNTRDLLDDLGFAAVRELAVGERMDLGRLTIMALPVQHWGARVFLDTQRGCNGYLLVAGARRLLFAGDTGDHAYYDDLGPIDLAIMGIGAYRPWAWAHLSPEQAWQMAGRCGAQKLLPIHHGSFPLGLEPMGEPMRRLLRESSNKPGMLLALRPGELWVPASTDG
jgi:L-ascorbate metabolism protein UlaG (beta-lactamase superfamily)